MSEQSQQFLEQLREAVATDQPTQYNEQALLAGLIHNIGALPIADATGPFADQPQEREDERHRLAIEHSVQTLSVV